MSFDPIPSNMLMLKGGYSGEHSVDPVMVQWCKDTLIGDADFGWHKRQGWVMRVDDPGGEYDVPVFYHLFCVKFTHDDDVIAFRLRWAEEVAPGT